MLPKLSGLDICRENSQKDESLNRLPILMLTARAVKKPIRVVGLGNGRGRIT